MNANDYITDPCKASSLPYWKTENIVMPEHIIVLRDDDYNKEQPARNDDQYFKMIHNLKMIPDAFLPDDFEVVQADVKFFANHINNCYEQEHVSVDELMMYKTHTVHQDDLWIAIMESRTKNIVASGIAELDSRIGEGILEWIQVSQEYRRLGLGKYVVCELLRRLQGRADFVTVSGRLANKSNPFELYKSCGFCNPVIWHVVSSL